MWVLIREAEDIAEPDLINELTSANIAVPTCQQQSANMGNDTFVHSVLDKCLVDGLKALQRREPIAFGHIRQLPEQAI